jgi:methionyl-tRNA synthetase
MVGSYRERMDRLDLGGALEAVWNFASRANRYVEESAPWKLAKDPAQSPRLDSVLYNLAESLRLIAVLVTPVMPNMATQIRAQLGVTVSLGKLDDEAVWGRLPSATKIGDVSPLFPKKQ